MQFGCAVNHTFTVTVALERDARQIAQGPKANPLASRVLRGANGDDAALNAACATFVAQASPSVLSREDDAATMPDLLIAPYLRLSEGVSMGPWDLLPLRDVDGSTALPTTLRDPVLELVEAYRLPSGGGGTFGAVAFPASEDIGAPFLSADMARLSRALVAGSLADNPPMVVSEDEQTPNAGDMAATSENALLYGHPLSTGSSYVIETGFIVKTQRFRAAVAGRPLPKVEPPIELTQPMFGVFDVELAAASYSLMEASDTTARRLYRSLDWYRVCLSNAPAVSADVRAGAVRTALEVLTGAGDKSTKLVRAVGRLLSDENTPAAQTRPSRLWKEPVQLTPDEWWLACLCELRNSIVHGDDVSDDQWIHQGHHHLDHAHDTLIRCLKTTIADRGGDPLLRLRCADRLFPRVNAEALRYLQQTDETL